MTAPDGTFDRVVTERLVIRRFSPADAPTFAGYRDDPAVARDQSWTTPYTLERAERFIASLADVHPDTPGAWFQFAVDVRATSTHVGDVAAFVDGDDPRLARVGVTLSPAAQGRGYATEALVGLLDYLLLARGKHRVAADCLARNTASARLLRRVGMRLEAHRVRSVWEDGEWLDELEFAVLRDEWVARRSAVSSPR